MLYYVTTIIQSILQFVNGILAYILYSLPPQDVIIMFKSLFDQKTLTLLILILSVINAASAILAANWPVALGWISSVAGWHAVWNLTNKK